MCAKDYSWHSTTCSCESGEYLAITIVDSVITCDEIIDTEDSVLTNVSCTVQRMLQILCQQILMTKK